MIALPVLFDRCAESCDAHTRAAAAAPSCHHNSQPPTRVGRTPVRCSHDRVDVATAAVVAPAVAPFAPMPMIEVASVPVLPITLVDRPAVESPPPLASPFTSRSLPLRV